MLTKEDFKGRLKAAMDTKGMKQAEIAEAVDTSPANISNYVLGKSFPPVDMLVEIAKKLDISLDWLCGIEKREQRDKTVETAGEVASLVICALNSLPDSCELRNIQIMATQQVGWREDVDGYGAYPVREDVEISVPAMVFKSGDIRTFLEDLMKMSKLLQENTFDCKFYERWLNDRIQALDRIPLAEIVDDDGDGLPF